ncbi:hypothetical protein F383_38612 [Gossypium arboreum]|uniref:Uncharacterized protein n=1 Tax=Gossypium arboreum TaxID=29729 RepID=A0A0B0MLA3_GOSAR|nr:hypothetical protein F383_38612 [Gossypium arboreum]
MCNCGIST